MVNMFKKPAAFLLAVLLSLGCAAVAFAGDEEEIRRCEIYVESNLTRMGYGELGDSPEIAVGDEIEILYEDSEPADIYVDGEKVYTFKGGDREFWFMTVNETGTVEITVKKEETVILSETFTVITSGEMYRRLIREELSAPFSLSLPDFSDPESWQGFPVGNPFLPLAYVAMLTVNFFSLLFAATRIIR